MAVEPTLMDPVRQEWEHGWFSIASAAPHASLRGVVRDDYCGWTEHTRVPVRRRELASTVVPLIISFGPPYRLTSGRDTQAPGIGPVTERQTFVAGLYDTWVAVDSATTSCALQVNFTPIGARRVLPCPMSELTGASIEVRDVFGAAGARLVDRLGNVTSWHERFALVDAFLLHRMQRASAVPPEVSWAWDALARQHGAARIGTLCAHLGWSPKRLIASFREHIGLPPKTVARILRFEQLVAQLGQPASVQWSTRALDRGFFDQSHLIRDFTEFAGCTPGAYLRERTPFGAALCTTPA